MAQSLGEGRQQGGPAAQHAGHPESRVASVRGAPASCRRCAGPWGPRELPCSAPWPSLADPYLPFKTWLQLLSPESLSGRLAGRSALTGMPSALMVH